MTPIDLRSDTVTQPSDVMRQAMLEAEVGDDVYGEDPTVNRLQEELAARLGKEAGLFMASGTMSNQVAINAHTHHSQEVICHRWNHVFNFEGGSAPAMSGVGFNLLDGAYGTITADQVEDAIRPISYHYPQTALICVENTHNKAGGTIFPLNEIQKIREVAETHGGLPMHLDGARLFNAVVATGIEPAEWAKSFDTISICLSKGLGAPVGSVLVGSREYIDRAVWVRKRFGGAMRQAGILAAAGLYALENNIDRLAEDHANARQLAESVNTMDGLDVDLNAVQTNILMINTSGTGLSEEEVRIKLEKEDVLVHTFGRDHLRAVTHLNVTAEDISRAIEGFEKVTADIRNAGE
ncbi:threonine aldolase family protein [Gemmatimonadota bacterium]